MATKLTSDFIPADCLDLDQGGVSGDLYLIDYADWLIATKTVNANKSVSAIALTNTGAQAVKYQLTRGASVPTTPLTVNNGGKSGWMHNVLTFIPTKNADIKAELANYVNFRRCVAIVVLDNKNVAAINGSDMGLVISTWEEAPNDPGKGGGLQITFSTPADVTLENMPPVNFFDTDRATTLAALEALLTPVP